MTHPKRSSVTRAEARRLVTVCDQCLTAACWHGEFMCQQSDHAGTIKLPVSKLRELGLEHPDYYSVERIARIEGGGSP